MNIRATGSFVIACCFIQKSTKKNTQHENIFMLKAFVLSFHLLSGVLKITEECYVNLTLLRQEHTLLTSRLNTCCMFQGSEEERRDILLKGLPAVSLLTGAKNGLKCCLALAASLIFRTPKRETQKSRSQPESSSSAFVWS